MNRTPTQILPPITGKVYCRQDLRQWLTPSPSVWSAQGPQGKSVSFDVSSLFTNDPLDETITILAKKAFTENWFNEFYHLNIKECDLVTLLQLATKDQLFQFEGNLYQQIDCVAMGSLLGPLMANAFLCSLEEKLERDNKLPNQYRRYVDDTITAMPDVAGAESFLSTLNECHPSIIFTMELVSNNKLWFLGMEITKNGCQLSTSVYRKPTNTGLFLHFHGHVDRRYKTSLLRTMVDVHIVCHQ